MKNIFILILLTYFTNIFAQGNSVVNEDLNNDSVVYPKADIHLGVSTFGFYLGSLVQTSEDWRLKYLTAVMCFLLSRSVQLV